MPLHHLTSWCCLKSHPLANVETQHVPYLSTCRQGPDNYSSCQNLDTALCARSKQFSTAACCRAKAAALGVGGVDDPSGVSPGTYVAVHLAQLPAATAVKLLQRVQASAQVCAARSAPLSLLPCLYFSTAYRSSLCQCGDAAVSCRLYCLTCSKMPDAQHMPYFHTARIVTGT